MKGETVKSSGPHFIFSNKKKGRHHRCSRCQQRRWREKYLPICAWRPSKDVLSTASLRVQPLQKKHRRITVPPQHQPPKSPPTSRKQKEPSPLVKPQPLPPFQKHQSLRNLMNLTGISFPLIEENHQRIHQFEFQVICAFQPSRARFYLQWVHRTLFLSFVWMLHGLTGRCPDGRPSVSYGW